MRILLIDDTARKLGRLRDSLSESGFEVLDESGLSVDLPARVQECKPDVVLIDSDSPAVTSWNRCVWSPAICLGPL